MVGVVELSRLDEFECLVLDLGELARTRALAKNRRLGGAGEFVKDDSLLAELAVVCREDPGGAIERFLREVT